nr:DUF1616 domain-containing protein [Methanosarcina horonobensis]
MEKMKHKKILFILILISLTILASGCEEKKNAELMGEPLKESDTELYILGPEGKADNYPTDYVLGENGTVIVGIVNHEQKPINYTLEVKLEGTPLPLPPDQEYISLEDNKTWEKAVTITPPFEGTHMALDFSLYKEGEKNIVEGGLCTPYRGVFLWINVSQNISENTSITAI